MKWEAKQMKSKKPFFSKEIIVNNLRRFWWIAVLFTLALFFVSPLITLTNGSDVMPRKGYNITFRDIYIGTVFFLCTVPVFIGVMVFRYMQNSKSMVAIHSMPYTRLRLYVNNIISGLILLVVPILLNAAFLSVIQLFNLGGTYFAEGIVLKYLGISLLTSVTLYVWTVFVGMFTGSSIAQIIYTYILNFLFAGLIFGVQLVVLYGTLYGYVFDENMAAKVLYISPIMQALDYGTGRFSSDMLSFSVYNFILVDIVICAIALVVGYFVYKYRNLETAGDVVSGKYIKPLFKYGVATCTLLLGGLYVKGVFNVQEVNLLLYLLFGLVGYVIAEMLIRKSFKIWSSYKGFLAFSAVVIVILFGLKADLFGYEKYVPDVQGVKAVSVNGNTNFDVSTYGVLHEKENIENVIKLHEKIIKDKNINLTDNIYSDGINISYQFIDGRVMERYYEFESGKYDEFLDNIHNSKEYIMSTEDIFDYDVKNIYGVKVSNMLINEDYVFVEKQDISGIFEAAKQDILYTSTENKDKNYEIYEIEFMIVDEGIKDTEEVTLSKYGSTVEIENSKPIRTIIERFNVNSENVSKFLEEHGYSEKINKYNEISKIRYYAEDGEKCEFTDKADIDAIVDIIVNKPREKNTFQRYWSEIEVYTDGEEPQWFSVDLSTMEYIAENV